MSSQTAAFIIILVSLAVAILRLHRKDKKSAGRNPADSCITVIFPRYQALAEYVEGECGDDVVSVTKGERHVKIVLKIPGENETAYWVEDPHDRLGGNLMLGNFMSSGSGHVKQEISKMEWIPIRILLTRDPVQA